MNTLRRRCLPLARLAILASAPILLIPFLWGCASRTSTLQREAVRLYDEGQYAEAEKLLEQIDESGGASGSLLYRLHYCQQATGNGESSETLERALETLEREMPEAESLEVPFYLVNAYQNVSRPEDGRAVAQATTERIESGDLREPDDPLEMFRLGKLYADQNRTAEARRWYVASIDGFSAGDEEARPYLTWAARYLAEPAFREGDYEGAARYYGVVADATSPTAADLDRLGESRFRLGLYTEAARAWMESATLDATDPDRPRYLSRLALLAAGTRELPAVAPDGRSWSEMGRDELRAFIVEKANRAKEILAQVRAPESLPAEEMQPLRASLRDVKTLFVASASEYALKRYGIREAAFFGGYAPLIFDKRGWRIASGPKKNKD